MKALKINRIVGHRVENNTDYFLVNWQDSSLSWEPVTSLNCASLIRKFCTKLKDYQTAIEEKESIIIKKQEERKMIREMKERKLKIQKTVERNEVENPKKIKFEKHVFNPLNNNNLLSKDKIYPQKNRVNENSAVNNNYFLKNTRYFEIKEPKPVNKTPAIVKIQSLKTPGPKNGIIFEFKNESLGSFMVNKIKCEKNNEEVPKRFTATHTADLSHLKIVLFSSFQNKNYERIKYYSMSLYDTMDKFIYVFDEVKKHGKVFMDESDPTWNYVIVQKDSTLEKYDLFGKYNLLKIHHSYFNENNAYDLTSATKNTFFKWYSDSFLYDSLIRNFYIFNTSSLGLTDNFNFGIFSDSNNIIIKDLAEYFTKRTCKLVSLWERKIEVVFISSQYLQYLHILPNFQNLLLTNCKFYVVGIRKKMPLVHQILPKGGILTLTKSVLQNKNVLNLINLLEIIDNSKGMWILKISRQLLEEYKQQMKEYESSLSYAGMEKIYKYIKNSVEDVECRSLEEYIGLLENKYLRTKRFFLIINDVSTSANIKTPSQIIDNYINRFS